MEKTAMYFGFCLGLGVAFIPTFFSVLITTEESSRLKAENQYKTERIESLEIYIQGYKESNLINRGQ